jgi:hypothetical protein
VYFLGKFDIPVLSSRQEDIARKRDRLRQFGKIKYLLLAGVLGSGVGFGITATVGDYFWRDSFDWSFELLKLGFISVAVGLFTGLQNWNRCFRDPVPFPPNYPPQK